MSKISFLFPLLFKDIKKFFPAILIFLVFPGFGFSEEPLVISFLQRPPYYYIENKIPQGFLLKKQMAILEDAKISYKLRSDKATGILRRLEFSEEKSCSVGWFKNKKREKFAKFTLPIYQDKSQVILTKKENVSLLSKYNKLEEIFADETLRMGVNESYSYGEYIDNLIQSFNPKVVKTSALQKNLGRMLNGDRFHYFFIAPEEIDTLIIDSGLQRENFVAIQLPEIPRGNKRYLMCSKSVRDEVIQKINASIKKQGPLPE